MSFTNQNVSSMVDLITKLDTFLAGTPGWTTHNTAFASGEWAARKTPSGIDIGFASQWDTAAPSALGIYHFHGGAYNSGNSPWDQNDDSGNGAASTTDATILGARFAGITDTPVQFWCFEDDHYFHVVVEWTFSGSLVYSHFGAGYLDKFNDWDGGEYVYGGRANLGTASDAAVLQFSYNLLDGLAFGGTMQLHAATIHMENMADQVAGGKYAVQLGNHSSGSLGNDRQTVPKARIHAAGGFRAGPGDMNWGQFAGTLAAGLLPAYPILTFHWNRTNGHVYGPLGVVKDVGGINIKNYVAGQELTISSDTWIVFPSFKKWISGSKSGTTLHQGMMYKKITT